MRFTRRKINCSNASSKLQMRLRLQILRSISMFGWNVWGNVVRRKVTILSMGSESIEIKIEFYYLLNINSCNSVYSFKKFVDNVTCTLKPKISLLVFIILICGMIETWIGINPHTTSNYIGMTVVNVIKYFASTDPDIFESNPNEDVSNISNVRIDESTNRDIREWEYDIKITVHR